MSDVSRGPGWWLASNGKWYPPESHPAVRTPEPPNQSPLAVPEIPPAGGGRPVPQAPSDQGPGRSWRWGPTAPVGHSSRWPPRRVAPSPARPGTTGTAYWRQLTTLLVVLVVVALAGGAAFLAVAGNTNGNSPKAGPDPTTSIASPTVTATSISLQESDLRRSLSDQTQLGSVVSSHNQPGPCTPLSSEPWLADVVSPEYSGSQTGLFASSDVVIMPLAVDARRAVAAISAPSYGPDCAKPRDDAVLQQSDAAVSQQADCDLELTGSTISALPEGVAGPGTSGWHYVADVVCTLTNTAGLSYTDVINEAVGPVVIQGTFRSLNSPVPASLEQDAIKAMAGRARARFAD